MMRERNTMERRESMMMKMQKKKIKMNNKATAETRLPSTSIRVRCSLSSATLQ